MKVTELKSDLITPSARSGHRFVSAGENIILFGGYTQKRNPVEGILKQEVWCFHVPTQQWKLVQTNPAEFPHSTASCAVIAVGTKVIVFGGSGTEFGRTNSDKLMLLDVETLEWNEVKTKGASLEGGYGHSIVLGSNGMLYIYGGCDGYHFFNSIHEIDMSSWTNISYLRGGHEGRYRAEAIAYNELIYIFGGGSPVATESLQLIPCFDTTYKKWSSVQVNSQKFPRPRVAHSCNKINNLVALVGGQIFENNVNIAVDEVWLLDLSIMSWSLLPITLPYGLFFHSSAVATNDAIYCFGGCTFRSIGDNATPVVERINATFKIEIFVPSLLELCWSEIRKLYPLLETDFLVKVGVPPYIAERVRTHVQNIMYLQ